MRRFWKFVVLGTLGLAACSGHSTTSNPPPGTSVALVEVSPGSGTLNVAGTMQLTATPRDSTGAAMAGVAISWTTSSPSVATVSSGGLVTAVSAGSATITATAGGKSGQAVITVAAVTNSGYGPVVAHGDIGSAGGTVSSTDIGVTIPPGAFTATRTLQLIRDTVSADDYSSNTASGRYFLDGLPSGVTVQAHVRIKVTGTNSGLAAIAVLRPGIASGDTIAVVMGMKLVPATDSSGYLVADIPLTGRTTWAGIPPVFQRVFTPGGSANLFNPSTLMADAEMAAILNLSHGVSSSTRYDVWGFGAGADMQAKVDKTVGYINQASSTLAGMGYDFAFRTSWPIQVYVHQINANGIFTLVGGWPQDLNQSFIEYNKNNVDLSAYPGTVIHEMFHFAKSGLFPLNSWNDFVAKGWLDEATSTWVAEKHPAVPQPFVNPTALAWKDSLFEGLSSGMVANSGYGRAPLIKYVVKHWGDAKVKEMLLAAHAGTNPTTAFLNAIPEAPAIWWPNLLIEHLGGSLYPWSLRNLVPVHQYDVKLVHGEGNGYLTDWLNPLAVEGEMIIRDTSMFGPNFVLPVYLSPADHGKGTIIAFQKSAASENYRVLAQGDTVLIPGYLLQRPDSILLLFTTTQANAPYNTENKLGFFTALTVPDADWLMPTVTNLASGVAFSCDKPGNTVSMNIGENATSIYSLLSQAGTWHRVRKLLGHSEQHTWTPTPAYADTLAKYQITLTSLLSTGAAGDSVRLITSLRMNTASSLLDPWPPEPAGLGWWWLAPLAGLPFVSRKRTRKLGVAMMGLGLLVLGACEVGQINFAIDETLDYSFTKMRFTADPARAADPVMQLYQGAGKTTIASYRSEYWSYITNGSGVKTDSTRVVCTGSGTATYTVDGTGYVDGAAPTTTTGPAGVISQILGRNPPGLKARVQQNMR